MNRMEKPTEAKMGIGKWRRGNHKGTEDAARRSRSLKKRGLKPQMDADGRENGVRGISTVEDCRDEFFGPRGIQRLLTGVLLKSKAGKSLHSGAGKGPPIRPFRRAAAEDCRAPAVGQHAVTPSATIGRGAVGTFGRLRILAAWSVGF